MLFYNWFSEEQNDLLLKILNPQELKDVIFSICLDSTLGPNGLTAFFYCNEGLQGIPMPGAILKNYICMVPKKDDAYKLGDFKPISLCNVLYKIFYKITTMRLDNLFPYIISKQQGAFVKGRLITKNMVLAQEMM